MKTGKILILDILLCIFTLTCNAQIYETSIQTRRIGYTTNYGNSFKQPVQVNNNFGTSFNSVNIHRNSIMTGGRVYTPSTLFSGRGYYSHSSSVYGSSQRRSPQRPYSGGSGEDFLDWLRINFTSDWPQYVDDDYWDELKSIDTDAYDYAVQWFEKQGKHFPEDQDDPFADPIGNFPIELLVLLILGYVYYRKRKTVSV